jgi:metal-responsive CopG/Arc/MetJ family transcriptional regulator
MTGNKMVSKRIDITLDTKVLKRLEELKQYSGLNKSAIISMLITDMWKREIGK